jgi:hypothetical protein
MYPPARAGLFTAKANAMVIIPMVRWDLMDFPPFYLFLPI